MLPPLPERMRPRNLDEYVGQKHLVGKGCVLRNMIEGGNLTSFILWGPPGVGKTSLARIVANSMDREFYTLSAVSSGVKDVREVIDRARSSATSMFGAGKGAPILFIDEIHRFNKAQQDALLGAVEDGTVILIGATTENPSFEVINPLLSRCQVLVLKSLEASDLRDLLARALSEDEILKHKEIKVNEDEALLRYSGGDARNFSISWKSSLTFPPASHRLSLTIRQLSLVFRPMPPDMTRVERCITTSFLPSSRVSAVRTLMRQSIIWPA